MGRESDSRFVDEALEKLLAGWCDWQSGQSPNPLGYARVSNAGASNAQGFRTSSVPVGLGAAQEIQATIWRLQEYFRDALIVEYLRPELTQEERAALLGITSRQTYVRRVDDAKRVLRDTLRAARKLGS